MIADEYDNWKLNSLFYNSFEYPIVMNKISELVKDLDNIHVLDMGTGTGFWIEHINTIVDSFKSIKTASFIGIDISENMIKIANEKKIPNSQFFIQDISSSYGKIGKFDLITAGLSIDYIGVSPSMKFIQNNLKPSGTALVWFFNPDRYKGQDPIIIKKWKIAGKIYEIHSNRINVSEISITLEKLMMNCYTETLKLPTVNDFKRELIFQQITHNKH